MNPLDRLPPNFAGRARFLTEADRTVIAGIKLGVLHLMAFWSASSMAAYSCLKKALVEVDPTGRLELVIVDIDGCGDLPEIPEFVGRVGGNGETAWIREGRIVFTSIGSDYPKVCESFTRRLLAADPSK